VYGLGASALSADAAAKIYAAKGRPSDNPLIVHVAKPEEAEQIACVPPVFYKLAQKYMPGPLTVIMPKRSCIPDGVTGGLDTVAVRCPAHPVARALIAASGVPIAAPSANRSGCPSPTAAAHVLRDMDGRIEMILDGGPCEIGLESTVIRLTADGCEILRPGAVTEFMLAEVAGSVSVAKAVIDPALAGDKPLSPGMKYKHYSPNAEVVLVDGDDIRFEEYVRSHIAGTEAVVVADSWASQFDFCNRLSFGKTTNAEEESRALFSVLREADDREYTRVYIQLPPPEGGYLALYNRLIRAAGGRIVHIK
jgi:L-threonylcarbamoyladenylate synthase